MARTLLSALATAPQRSRRALWRWCSARWRQQDSPMGKGLLALVALSMLLCPCLAGCAPAPATPEATLTSAPSATFTEMPTQTAAPTRTATVAATPEPTGTSPPTLVPTAEPTGTPPPTLVPTAEPTQAPTVVQATTAPPTPAGGCAYIGNRSSMIFHYPGCSYVARMSERNKVCLPSREAAIQQGYRPCQVCNP